MAIDANGKATAVADVVVVEEGRVAGVTHLPHSTHSSLPALFLQGSCKLYHIGDMGDTHM